MTEKILNLEETKGRDLEATILRECAKDIILSELVCLSDKSELKKAPTKPGCYFVLSRKSDADEWVFRNIGTYHASVRERLRQHCYAPKGTKPHSQKYEVHKSPGQWRLHIE